MGQTERKELLSQFIGLNLFDKLASLASDKTKELSGAVKLFNKENGLKKISQTKNDIELLDAKLNDLNEQKDALAISKNDIDAQIEAKKDTIVKLENVPTNIMPIVRERDVSCAKEQADA
jgi:hypothetical protein